MSNTEIEQSSPDRAEPNVESGSVVDNVGANRRRLFKAGLTVAPAVLTMTSRPVLAWHCQSPSAIGSMPRSKVHNDCASTNTNQAQTCDWWKNKTSWPQSCNPDNQFSSIFSGQRTGKTCKQVLQMSHSGYDMVNLHKCLLGAYLNWKMGWGVRNTTGTVICLTDVKIKSMAGGLYVPIPGKPTTWGPQQIIEYLNNNYIATAESTFVSVTGCNGLKPGFFAR